MAENKIKELIKKYNIDIDVLKTEQKKLSKDISLKDSIDFKLTDRIAGIAIAFFNNSIVVGIVVLNSELEIIDQQYSSEKLRFPYLPEFRAYRELPAMISAFHKLQEIPDIIFIEGHGICHPRMLGIASHFSLSIRKPTIGIAKSLLVGEIKKGDVEIRGKICGKELRTKEGSKPIYISPGNIISLKTAIELTQKYIKEPHKLPEPMVQARKYVKKIRDELARSRT